jgi:Helix-turn-helix domain
MMENLSLDSTVAPQWSAIVLAYCELMDDVMPHLPDSEQIVYHRLFRLSHVRQSPFLKCRYEDLTEQCGLSLSTVRRAVKGLRAKKLVKTLWQSHSGTTFEVYLPSSLSHRPAFLPRHLRGRDLSSSLTQPSRPPVYHAFSPEDRALFIACKQRLSPARLNELTEAAVEWLTERVNGDPDAFSDELLRDKVDELVFDEVFGPDRRRPYERLFSHLHRLATWTSLF